MCLQIAKLESHIQIGSLWLEQCAEHFRPQQFVNRLSPADAAALVWCIDLAQTHSELLSA